MEESDSYRAEHYRLEKIAAEVEGRVDKKTAEYRAFLEFRLRRLEIYALTAIAMLAGVSSASLYFAFTAADKAEQAIERVEKVEGAWPPGSAGARPTCWSPTWSSASR